MQRSEGVASAAIINEIIKRIATAELIAVLPYQDTYHHTCSIAPNEKSSFVAVVTRLPSDCLAEPSRFTDIIKNFVVEALDSAMLTLDQQFHCPEENFYIIEVYDAD